MSCRLIPASLTITVSVVCTKRDFPAVYDLRENSWKRTDLSEETSFGISRR